MGEIDELSAIGHRVVHGGEQFQKPTLIDSNIVESIRDLCALAPLHNPANLTASKSACNYSPDTTGGRV